jgi:CubicO group peptidase (beta-lactamase class C family)
MFIVLLLGAAAVAPARAGAQVDGDALPPDLAGELDEAFGEWDRLDRPGGSVAVIRDGQVVFQQSYGLASLEHRVPNGDGTLYDVAALAEPITATAVAALLAEGRISLDDEVRDHLPELAAHDPPLRLADLVYHTSGLWDWQDAWRLSGGFLEDVITVEQILALLGKQSSLTFEPGSRFEWCVSNYTLLAEIVARVTNEPFRDWLWINVLRPAGMTRSLVRDTPGESVEGSGEAYDYHPRRGYRRGTLNLAAPGAHGLYATIGNMADWLIDVDVALSSGEESEVSMLDSGVLNDGTPIAYVHGLHRDEYHGLTRLRADGSWQGFNSALQYFPAQRFGVVILCNWTSRWVNPVYQCGEIVDLLLADAIAAADSSAAASDEEAPDEPTPDEPAPDFTPDPGRYAQLVGDYRWEPGDVFGVIVDQDRLAYQSGRRVLPMTELAEDRFVLDDYPYYFSFHRDAEGRATSCLIEHAGDPDVTAPRIELVTPAPDALAQLAGEYVSPELGTTYTVVLEDDELFISHQRQGRTRLVPEAADHFTATSPAFRLLRFVRDQDGGVSGFGVDTLNLVFHKRS